MTSNKEQSSGMILFGMPQNRGQEIVHQINPRANPAIEEGSDEAAQTSTPVRPPPYVTDVQKNPEDAVPVKEQVKDQPKSYKKIIIIVSVILVLSLIGATIAIINLVNRPKFQTVVVNNYISIPMASSNQNVRTQTLQIKDPQVLKSQAPIDVFVSQTQQASIQNTPNRLLQQATALSTYTIYDKALNCAITICSKGFQMKLVIDVSKLLTFIFSAQPLPKEQKLSKEQKQTIQTTQTQTDTNTEITKYIYTSIGDKISKLLKDKLHSIDPKATVSQTSSYSIQFSKDKNAFKIVSSPETNEVQNAILYTPSQVKVVQDLNNQDQLAKVAYQVVYGALQKAKQFFQKRSDELAAKTNVKLAANVPDFGQTSIYLDSASDFQKECTPVGNKIHKCDTMMLSSNAINIDTSQDIPMPSSDIKLAVDL